MKSTSTEESRSLAIDIEDLAASKQGQKLINTLMSSKGVLYRTKRGRLAIQIRPDTLERIKPQLKISLEDGLDGTRLVVFLKAEKATPNASN